MSQPSIKQKRPRSPILPPDNPASSSSSSSSQPPPPPPSSRQRPPPLMSTPFLKDPTLTSSRHRPSSCQSRQFLKAQVRRLPTQVPIFPSETSIIPSKSFISSPILKDTRPSILLPSITVKEKPQLLILIILIRLFSHTYRFASLRSGRKTRP